jgi:NADPH-dependent glutamate synthase beta subunit-like oxidoreductase/Pyruvate/2-oxoacid:ferredoxin oxidoreductase delta subunit
LSAAYHLARLGYAVTLIEAGEEWGGVLRTGIPAYRLPRDVLNREIDFILNLGIAARTGQTVNRNELLTLTKEFSAVFLATGLQEARSLQLSPAQGGSSDVVLQGIEFLDRARNEAISVYGEYVLVIGGGNTAIDAARSARRLGAREVRVVYRRTRQEMPAIAEEIEAAIEEGIRIDELVSPLRLQLDGAAPYLTCQRMRLGAPDETGRAAPVAEISEDAYFDLRCDRVILALGQSADLSILPEGAELRHDNALLGLTGAPVFCGGDFAGNDGTVAAAIGSGRKAAWHIHRTLTGEDMLPQQTRPVAGPEHITTHVFTHVPRHPGSTILPGVRRRSFAEVHRGFEEDAELSTAVMEAQRCFSCGVCNECDRCVCYCPEGILTRADSEYRFDYDYCKGCGVCAAQCPRGVIYMAEL